MKEEEIEARVTLVCYLGAFKKYGEQMFNVFAYLSGRAERLQSDQFLHKMAASVTTLHTF